MEKVEKINAGVVSQHDQMGAETISKNGRNSKSHTSRNLTLLTAVLALVVVFATCKKDDTTVMEPMVKADIDNYCGEATIVELIGVGSVTVVNDEDFLYVTFDVNGSVGIQRTHLYIGVTPPTGNPNSYPNRVQHSGAGTYTYVFPLTYLPGEEIYIGAYAQLSGNANGEITFTYVIQECEQEEGVVPKLGPRLSSVTATNGNFVVPNSNHFTYAKLDYDALVNGQAIGLDLVMGNGLNKVGTAQVTLVGGNLVISILQLGTGSYGALAFNMKDVPKNGNIHSLNSFKHNNVLTIPCPSPDALGLIYLYLHCDNIRFYQ